MRKKTVRSTPVRDPLDYKGLLSGVSLLLNEARSAAARSVNAILTITYWEIGQRIVEFEQDGSDRAPYGATLLKRLSRDLTTRFGRGFSEENLRLMRLFYLHYRERISQTLSGKSLEIASAQSQTWSQKFPLSWSHYVRLLTLDDSHKRDFYEEEARRATRERSRQAASTDLVRHLRRQGRRHLRRGLDEQASEQATDQACTSGSINMLQTTSGKCSVSWLFYFRLLRFGVRSDESISRSPTACAAS